MRRQPRCAFDPIIVRHLSTIPPMRSFKRWCVAVTTTAFMVSGCAHGPTTVKMDSGSVARRLGVPYCRVSVPLAPSEVIADAKAVGNPHPEQYPEWIQMNGMMRAGDELRAINCLGASRSKRTGNPYYYALIRDEQIIFKFYIGFFDY